MNKTKKKSKGLSGPARITLLALLAGGVVHFARGAMEEAEQESAARQQKVEAHNAQCIAEAQVVEASTLFAAMEENEAKVAHQWKGTCMKVHGWVKDVSEGPLGGLTVRVNHGKKYDIVNNVVCRPIKPQEALELVAGQEIIIQGVGGAEVMGSLVLEQCSWAKGAQ